MSTCFYILPFLFLQFTFSTFLTVPFICLPAFTFLFTLVLPSTYFQTLLHVQPLYFILFYIYTFSHVLRFRLVYTCLPSYLFLHFTCFTDLCSLLLSFQAVVLVALICCSSFSHEEASSCFALSQERASC